MIFRALVLRPLLRERLRSILTLLGIAVGVAVIVAVQLANQSALRAFRESVDAVAGKANYQIAADAGSLDENILLRLRTLWRSGLRFAPVLDVEGMIEPSQTPIRLLAVDLLSDVHFREYRYASIAGAPAASPGDPQRYLDFFRHDSVILPAPLARQRGLTLGSPITLNILGRRKTMIIRGLLEAHGPATAFNGSIAVCDIAAAQASFDLAGKITRVDLLVPKDGEAGIVAAVQTHLSAGMRIERPSRRNDRVEEMLRAFRVNLFALAGVALLVGMFLVYNTVLIAILRRRRDVGILKTLGVAPWQIFRIFLAEGALFGVVGSALGVMLGHVLATALLGLVGRTVNSLYVSSKPSAVSLTPAIIVMAILIGTLLSVASAIQPSLEAARIRPSILIREGLQQRLHRAPASRLTLAAVLLFLGAAGVSRLPPYRGIAVAGYVAVLMVVIGFSLLAPLFVRRSCALLRVPFERVFGIVGRLACVSLPASLRRAAVASAALSLAIGMMVAVALMVGSFRETVRIWVNQTVSSDLWLRPSHGLSNSGVALFPPEIGPELQRVPFIKAIDRVRGREVIYEDVLISVGSGEFGVASRFSELPMVRPRSARTAMQQAIRVGGVLISESFALKFAKDVGDSVTLPVARGSHRFPIAGIYRDYSNDRGVVVMDRAQYVRLFEDEAINTIVVFLEPGIHLEDARRNLERTFGPRYRAFVVTNAEIRTEVMKIFDQTFVITYALLAIAVVVAVLGIVNTLSALIIERRRELALLRVGGISSAQLRTMILLESSVLGLTSVVAGVVMGYALSSILIHVINKQSFGWTIEFHVPLALISTSLGITFLAAIVAGVLPARMAGRIHLATAIKGE